MKTPAGQECKFYYADFHRGRNRQECRLLQGAPHSPAWRPSDCAQCQVPQILGHNASPYLELTGKVKLGVLGLRRRMEVSARCSKHNLPLKDPHIGCPMCAAEQLSPLEGLFDD